MTKLNNLQELKDLHLNLLLGDKLAFLKLVDYSTISNKGYQSFTVKTGDIDIDKVSDNLAKVEYKGRQDEFRHLVGFLSLQ